MLVYLEPATNGTLGEILQSYVRVRIQILLLLLLYISYDAVPRAAGVPPAVPLDTSHGATAGVDPLIDLSTYSSPFTVPHRKAATIKAARRSSERVDYHY